MPKEPQSYGSNEDWVTGKTGQTVQDQKSSPPPEHRDFYDARHESEQSAPTQGGLPSPHQEAESAGQSRAAGGAAEGEDAPAPKVTTQDGGAKRDSFFRKRDYE